MQVSGHHQILKCLSTRFNVAMAASEMPWFRAACGTCHNGHFAQQPLRDASNKHHPLEAHLHLLRQLFMLFVLGLMIHKGTSLALPAVQMAYGQKTQPETRTSDVSDGQHGQTCCCGLDDP